MNSEPRAGAGMNDDLRAKIRAQVQARNLASAANNTKWDELIEHFRQCEGWTPSYRYKWVNGHVSGWDVEWYAHLPFPFAGVEWFDIGLWQALPAAGRLLPSGTLDHTDEIAQVVTRIGLAFEVRADVMRIWGYLPKSYEDFPPA